MTRSLTFPYLFIMLAVSYIGGTLLFREMSEGAVEKVFAILDPRIVKGHEASWFMPVIMTFLFFALVIGCARFTYSRLFTLFIAAIKCVLFGVSSAYLLAKGLKMYEYAIWWFPFQLLICFSLLLFASIMTPPFFMKTIGKVERNEKALVALLVFSVILIVIENLVFFIFIH